MTEGLLHRAVTPGDFGPTGEKKRQAPETKYLRCCQEASQPVIASWRPGLGWLPLP